MTGGDVGVYIQGTSATLIDCTVKDHSLSNVELLRSGPEMQLRGCKIEGGHEAGLHCCEASSAVLTDCHIFSSGMAGLAAQEAAKINLHRCTIRSGWEGGVMAMGKDTAVELQECIISFNTEVGIEAKQQACICLKKSTVRSNGTAGVLSRLEGQVHIDKCRGSDNGLAGVEVREKGIAQVNDSVLYGKSPKSAPQQNDKDCSPQSLPAFLTSHDSVGAGLFGELSWSLRLGDHLVRISNEPRCVVAVQCTGVASYYVLEARLSDIVAMARSSAARARFASASALCKRIGTASLWIRRRRSASVMQST